jgi:hypothetical protein
MLYIDLRLRASTPAFPVPIYLSQLSWHHLIQMRTGRSRYSKALEHYELAGKFLHGEEMMDVDLGNSDARREELGAARLTLLLNMAQALLKTATEELMEGMDDEKRVECFESAIQRCDQALKLDAKSTKALYRRAAAREHLGQLELAEEDLRSCRELSPTDRQVRAALARVALGARTARTEREAGFRGSLPPPPEPIPPSRAVRFVTCWQRWGPPALFVGCTRCRDRVSQTLRSDMLLDTLVPVGVALLSALYCAWKGVGSMEPDDFRSHAIALVGLVLGSCMWAYEARNGPMFGEGGFREGIDIFGESKDPRSRAADGQHQPQGEQQQAQTAGRQQAPKIKIMDKDGKTVKFEYQAKPGEFGVDFK